MSKKLGFALTLCATILLSAGQAVQATEAEKPAPPVAGAIDGPLSGDSLVKDKADAKAELAKLQYLNANSRAEYGRKIDLATKTEEIAKIVQEATKDNEEKKMLRERFDKLYEEIAKSKLPQEVRQKYLDELNKALTLKDLEGIESRFQAELKNRQPEGQPPVAPKPQPQPNSPKSPDAKPDSKKDETDPSKPAPKPDGDQSKPKLDNQMPDKDSKSSPQSDQKAPQTNPNPQAEVPGSDKAKPMTDKQTKTDKKSMAGNQSMTDKKSETLQKSAPVAKAEKGKLPPTHAVKADSTTNHTSIILSVISLGLAVATGAIYCFRKNILK